MRVAIPGAGNSIPALGFPVTGNGTNPRKTLPDRKLWRRIGLYTQRGTNY